MRARSSNSSPTTTSSSTSTPPPGSADVVTRCVIPGGHAPTTSSPHSCHRCAGVDVAGSPARTQSLSTGARHSDNVGPSITPLGRTPAPLSSADGRWAARSCSKAKSTWAHATSNPTGAHASSAASVTWNSRLSAASGTGKPRSNDADEPGATSAGIGTSWVATTAPSTSTSHDSANHDSERKSCRFSIRRSGVIRTGDASWRCSSNAGLGRRSGHTTPSRQKFPSCGDSPQSPP